MFVFEYKYDDYKHLIASMANQLGVTLQENNTLIFPSDIADGYYQMVELPNGLQVNLINCVFNCDWYLHRKRSEVEYYTLRFDEFTIPDKLIMSIDNEQQTSANSIRSLIYLTSSLFDASYLGTSGTHARGINILIKADFAKNYLGLNTVDDLLKNYIALKAESYDMERVDADYVALMNEILMPQQDQPFENLFMLNRIQLLIEKFFNHLHTIAHQQDFSVKLANGDINRIMQAAHILTNDFAVRPPSIEALARMSAMSISRFKTSFKMVYGQPVYSHYQVQRLTRARELLISGKYNVKEAGEAVAYDNTSNFIAAFKKQFNMLPGALLGKTGMY